MKFNRNSEITEDTDSENSDVFVRGAELAYKNYPDQIDVFESSCMKSVAGVPVTPHDIATVGERLKRWDDYTDFCESQGSLADLGPMLNYGLDLIAAVNTQNVLPLIASQQTLDDLQGTVYVKKIQRVNADGSLGTDLRDVTTGSAVYDSTHGAGRTFYSESNPLVTSDGTNQNYTINYGKTILPQTVRLTAKHPTAGTWKLMDDGQGNVMGSLIDVAGTPVSLTGTVDYASGVIVLEWSSVMAAGITVIGQIDNNIEAEDNMVTITSGLVGIPVLAEFFGLKSESGLLADFAFSRRFGRSGADEQAQDLMGELVTTMNSAGIQRIAEAFPLNGATANWSLTPSTGVSSADHKLSFIDTLSEAEMNLSTQAGRGTVNRMIAGRNAAAVLRGMPQWESVAGGGANHQIGLYGYFDGIPVIRGVDSLLPSDSIFGLYMGTTAFDAPMVVADYLPIFATSTLPVSSNPLRSMKGVATLTAIKSVLPSYITKIEMT